MGLLITGEHGLEMGQRRMAKCGQVGMDYQEDGKEEETNEESC